MKRKLTELEKIEKKILFLERQKRLKEQKFEKEKEVFQCFCNKYNRDFNVIKEGN